MLASDLKISAIVTRTALMVAAAVALALPLGYWTIDYTDFSNQLAFKAKVKATALGAQIAESPELWMYAENRLQGTLAREPVVLDGEAAQVYDQKGALLAQAGELPAPPVLRRSQPLYDATRLAGRVDVSDSMLGLIAGTAAAAALGLLLGSLVFYALRTIPLRALRRVMDALFVEKERAEVTLRSIGEAVITTDATARVVFLNPVAEQLTRWDFGEARGRPLAAIFKLVDSTSGDTVPASLQHALEGRRAVAPGRDLDLVRRDGSRIGIDESAAPMRGPDGRITGGVLIFRDITIEREFSRQRSWEAAHDVLTGLVNRREFENLVEAAVVTARNAGKHHVICYMDLDQFKVVNDTSGHAAGDELLRQIAALLQSRIRKSDTLARLGGDEFGLMLEGCSLERAKFIAADLLAAIGDFRFAWEAKVFTIGVSIGLATITDANDSSADVLSKADTACYWAKEQGRNRVSVYRSGDKDMAERRREIGWIARLNLAISENRFTLYHQEYLSLNAGAGDRRHLEVLLRMIDEDGKLVQPSSFLPAAERYNLMPTIDRWVVRTVFARYGDLAAARGGAPLTCAINLSGTSLNAEGFLAFVREQAALHALPPLSICFEITETAAINNLRTAAEFIRECKAMGFLFALDDFGTGTSSFGYLKNLPVDFLKIDGGFVRNLEHDPIDKAMTETINRIGHIMGIQTIAEYAESDTIIQELRTMGVDYAQGYGVCLPSPLFVPVPSPAARRSTESTAAVALAAG